MGLRSPSAWPAPNIVDPAPHRLPALVVTAPGAPGAAGWREARGLDGPLVLFQPGNKRTHKRGKVATRQHAKSWPPERWAQVVSAIREATPDARILLCGSEPERAVL